jgi:hypothetical protein
MWQQQHMNRKHAPAARLQRQRRLGQLTVIDWTASVVITRDLFASVHRGALFLERLRPHVNPRKQMALMLL